MAFAISRFEAYGVAIDEPITKKFIQRAVLNITGLATDIDLDLGDNTGTFFTAVGATEPGLTALKALKDIQLRAKAFLSVQGTGINAKTGTGAAVKVLSSAASSGGAATEALTVTGLLTTDTIIAVSQRVKGANSTALNGWNTQVADGITASWTANPGANSIVDVAFVREGGAPNDGEYNLTVQNVRPNLLFKSGDAPLVYVLVLQWELNDGYDPVKVLKTA